jgi:Flp pilus assembly pilin Flp
VRRRDAELLTNIERENSGFLAEVENMHHLYKLWRDEEGQDIAEYAVMLAVILVIVVGTIRLIGSNANNVFSNVASSIQ